MNKKDDIYFMELALLEAKKAFEINEVPIGAIVVSEDGLVIGSGYNCKETKNNCLAHAEIIAINNACGKLNSWRLSNCILYTNMEPCMMCMGAINESRISKIVYLMPSKYEQTFVGDCVFLNDFKLRNKNSCLIQKFFKNLRNK